MSGATTVARVGLRLEPGSQGCRIIMAEDATHGPGRFVPAPLRRVSIVPRNTECRHRLALLAEGHRVPRSSPTVG